MQSRMIVLLADGTRLKGHSRDFNPARPGFHLQIVGPEGATDERREVAPEDLYAVFFVRDFAFDRGKRPEPEAELGPIVTQPPAGARALRVTTAWGEVIEGLTYGYQPQRPGFFLFPTSPPQRTRNLERAYLTRQAVVHVESPSPDPGAAVDPGGGAT